MFLVFVTNEMREIQVGTKMLLTRGDGEIGRETVGVRDRDLADGGACTTSSGFSAAVMTAARSLIGRRMEKSKYEPASEGAGTKRRKLTKVRCEVEQCSHPPKRRSHARF